MLWEQIQQEVHAAQRDLTEAGKRRLSVLRMLMAALKNEEIALKTRQKGLADEQTIAVVRREVKKRRDAVALYRSHDEEERAHAEEAEVSILAKFLPAAPDEGAMKRAIGEIIASLPESERDNIGKIMKEAMARFKGSADGTQVRALVQEAISH